MKLLILMLILTGITFARYAHSNPFDLYMNQMSADGTGYQNRQISVPNSGAGVDGLMFYSGTNTLPMIATMGSGCAVTFGVFNCSGVGQVNSDWNSVISPTQILNKPTIPAAQVNSDWNSVGGLSQILNKPTLTSGTVTSIGLTSSNLTVTGSPITSSGTLTIALPSVGAAGTYNGSVTTDAQGRVTTGLSASQSAQTRTLNSAYQVSATRGAFVNYSVRIVTTASIGGNQDGDVILEIASDSGFTTNVQTLSITQNAQSISLAVVLNSVQTQTGVLSGYVPPAYYARLRTVNNTGTPTYTYRSGQEILM